MRFYLTPHNTIWDALTETTEAITRSLDQCHSSARPVTQSRYYIGFAFRPREWETPKRSVSPPKKTIRITTSLKLEHIFPFFSILYVCISIRETFLLHTNYKTIWMCFYNPFCTFLFENISCTHFFVPHKCILQNISKYLTLIIQIVCRYLQLKERMNCRIIERKRLKPHHSHGQHFSEILIDSIYLLPIDPRNFLSLDKAEATNPIP